MADTPGQSNPFQSLPLLRALPESLKIHAIRSGETLDYTALCQRVVERAEAIQSAVKAPAGRVVIGAKDPIRVLVNLFATWVAGRCAVLVNPNLSEDEKHRVKRKVTPGLWVDDDALQVLDGAQEPSLWPDAALILMTSGTTGDPKGVTHALATLETRLKLNVAEIGADTLANTLCPLPLFFGHGLIGNCLTPLMAGQKVHILETPALPDYAAFGALMDRCDITFLSSVPSMWRMILKLSPPPEKHPHRVHVGSAPLPHALWSEIAAWSGTEAVFNTYGMTETANWISGGTQPAAESEGFVGAPWGGEFRVLRDGALFNEGRGEVALKSPTLMLGLWASQDQSMMMDDHFLTGDIAELAPDQTLRLVGRTKNEINRGGIKVLAEEVDMLLERHPDVAEACSFGIPDEISGELVGAVIRLEDSAVSDATAVSHWCRTQARAEAVPHRIAIVAEIKKTDRGKLARQEIRKEMLEQWS